MHALLHKVSLGAAPGPISDLFKLRSGTLDSFGFSGAFRTHARQLHDPIHPSHPVILKRSVFGLIRVYNRLPSQVLDAKSPKIFQRRLQCLAKEAAKGNAANWQLMFHAC